MTAIELMTDFQQRGIVLTDEDGRIRYRAPSGVLTDADRAALRAHKVELLALLPPSPPASAPPVATGPARPGAPKECFSHKQDPQSCPGCGGRAWRLRETPGSAGYWLWVCAGCADALAGASPP